MSQTRKGEIAKTVFRKKNKNSMDLGFSWEWLVSNHRNDMDKMSQSHCYTPKPGAEWLHIRAGIPAGGLVQQAEVKIWEEMEFESYL